MSAPEMCPCRFCGEKYTPAGIKNHERWCDDHPEQGMDPDRAEELGLLEDSETAGADESPSADPHQRDNPGERLPSRQELPHEDNSYSNPNRGETVSQGGENCPGCGSTDVITAEQALAEFRDRLEDVPDGLVVTLEASERYCNECYSVSGGALSEPFDLNRGVAQ